MNKIAVLLAGLLLIASNIFADDVSIDSSGNVKTGVSNSSAELEVTGASGESGILGSTSGTGAAGVYGINTTYSNYGILGYDSYGVYGYSTSWAGYFDGNAKVTGNLTVDGNITGLNMGNITAVNPGAGLSGGGTSGSITLSVDTTSIQSRITGSCPSGQAINVIYSNGGVSCEIDDGLMSESDPTVNASVKDGVSWSEVSGIPAGFADGVDNGLTAEDDPTVTASVKDGVSWAEVSGIPAGFADGVDNGLTSESDPKVGSNTTSYVPKWNGSSLVSGTIYDNGYVGIGTTSPSVSLHVVGNLLIDESTGDNIIRTTSNSVTIGGLTGGNDVNFKVMDATIYDEALLFDSSTATFYLGSGSTTTAGDDGDIYVYNSDGRTSLYVDGATAQISLGYGSSTDSGNDGDLFVKNNAGTSTISLDGQTGTTTTQVLTITGGADLSEQFEVNSRLKNLMPAPGMLVSIDPANPGELMLSTTKYDRKVAGIISGAGGIKTGMMMGQADSIADGVNPVALTGRVYAWVDASYGAVNPGDMLTTSDTPGHAMKVKEHNKSQGAVIGKAMTSLKNGKGLVLVLVSLQ